jgi:type VI secretion system protein ImpL
MLRGDAGSKNARVAMQMGELRQWLNLIQHSPDSFSSNNPSRKLLLTSQGLAAPFSEWTESLAQSAQNLANSQKAGQLNLRWQSEVAQACKRAFNGRFPFSSNADADTSLNDFEDFFAPGGIEESFVQEYLSALIKKQNGTLSRGTIWSIRQAERVREAFFANGRDLGFTYQLTGVDVDDRIGQLIIESGSSQRVRFKHGPPVPLKLTWPDGDKGIKITFMLKDGSVKRRIIDGPWAMFRAVSSGRMEAGNRRSGVNSLLVTFSDGDHNATFRLSSDSRINPFLPGLLDKYRCRSSL